jgi:uncharacterized membrane protein YqjE
VLGGVTVSFATFTTIGVLAIIVVVVDSYARGRTA